MSEETKTPPPAATDEGAGNDLGSPARNHVGKDTTPHPKKAKQPYKLPDHCRFRHYRDGLKVHCYEGRGIMTEPVRLKPGNPAGTGGGKRGLITGWSAASRKRCREVLLTTDAPEGWATYGVTITIPGPVATEKEQRDLWAGFCHAVQDAGMLLKWRLEVQSRGAWHWHGLLSFEVPLITDEKTENSNHKDPLITDEVLREVWHSYQRGRFIRLWFDSLDKLGSVSGELQTGRQITDCLRSQWPGAKQYAVLLEPEGKEKGRWLRYISDHATKRKQGQVATDIGRHWGIVGRKHLRSIVPETVQLSERQRWAYIRARQRLSTPRVRDIWAPFDRKLGRKNRRGSVGRSVWFGSDATNKRLLEWVRAEYP